MWIFSRKSFLLNCSNLIFNSNDKGHCFSVLRNLRSTDLCLYLFIPLWSAPRSWVVRLLNSFLFSRCYSSSFLFTIELLINHIWYNRKKFSKSVGNLIIWFVNQHWSLHFPRLCEALGWKTYLQGLWQASAWELDDLPSPKNILVSVKGKPSDGKHLFSSTPLEPLVFRLGLASQSPGGFSRLLVPDLSFWFWMGPKNLHFEYVPKWSWCCYTLRTAIGNVKLSLIISPFHFCIL